MNDGRLSFTLVLVMKNPVLLSSGSLRNYGLDRIFEVARSVGFDGIEVIVDGCADAGNSPYLRKLTDRYDLPVEAIHAPFNFIDPPGWEKDEVSRLKRSVRLAEETGASTVILHTPFFTERSYRRWLEEELDAYQETTGVVLVVENMPHYRKLGGRLGVWLNGPSLQEGRRKKAWRFLPDFLNPACFPLSDPAELLRFPNLILDTTHLATGGLDPLAVYDELGGRVVHIHLSNFDGREHLELRKGVLDIPRFIAHVCSQGFSGKFCLEIMPEYFPSEDEEFTVGMLRENLKLIRGALTSAPSISCT